MFRKQKFIGVVVLCAACGGHPDRDDQSHINQEAAPPVEERQPLSEPPRDGRSLLFPDEWSPGFVVEHRDYDQPLFLQDYSYAGYHNGEQPIPTESENLVQVQAVDDGSRDASGAIQAALNQALSDGGGIVALGAGLYRIDNPLKIQGSGVVLRGAGSDQTRLWFRNGGGTTDADKANLLVTGSNWLQEESRDGWELSAEGAIFDTWVELSDAAGLNAGDDISIAWDITPEFKAAHNSSDYWYHVKSGERKTIFRRTITRVEGNKVHFKVPLRYPVKLRDGPVVMRANGYASENGLEGFSFTNAVGLEQAWNSFNQSTAILLRFCKDCWIRDLKSFAHEGAAYQVRSHGISIERSFRVTLTECHLEKAEHLGEGGNGYLYQLSRSNEVLVSRSIGRHGRHNFSINWDFGASGNVFQGIESTGGRVCSSLEDQQLDNCSEGPTDFHHALAIANLFDSAIINDALQVGNRQHWSTGAGQTGTMNLFWNITGEGQLYAYNQGLGYVVGTGEGIHLNTQLGLDTWPHRHISPGTEPEDFSEYVDQVEELWPQSLYDEQLKRRLGL